MERYLALSRDPFASSADGELYWESEERAGLRRGLADQLLRGRSVRVEGPPGLGRRSLLTRVAGDLAAAGVPVALCDGPGASGPEGFLGALAGIVGAEPPAGADRLTLAEHLYRRLVDVFCVARPAVVVLPWTAAGDLAEEVGILSELRLLGRPLVAVATLGSPSLAAGGFTAVRLPDLDPDDLLDFLSHRCAAAGRPDLLDATALAGCLAGPPGLPAVLRRARTALHARAFAAALEAPGKAVSGSPAPVLDPAQVQEVRRLLDALSPEPL